MSKKEKQENMALVPVADTQLLVRTDPSGQRMVAYKAAVSLEEGKKEICTIQKSTMVTAAGAQKINQIASLQLITVPTVIVDGKAQGNPYVERHPETRAITAVWIRKVALGPGPTGNLVAKDRTIYFNLRTYFIQDLQAKVKRTPAAGMIGTRDDEPKEIVYAERKWQAGQGNRQGRYVETGKTIKVKPKGKLAFYLIEEPVGLWVDTGHPDVIAAFNEHTSRQKFAERHAESIVERNLICAHPAVAAKTITKDQGGHFAVTVTGWRHDLKYGQSVQIANQIAGEGSEGQDIHNITGVDPGQAETLQVKAGEEIIDVEIEDEPEEEKVAEVEHGDLEASDEMEEIGESPEDEGDADPVHQEEEPEEETQEEEPSDERAELLESIKQGKGILGGKDYQPIVRRFSPKGDLEELTTAQLKLLDRKIGEAVDLKMAS